MDEQVQRFLDEWQAGLCRAEAELGVTHRDGIPWHEAPIPPRWHRCRAWSTCTVDRVRRCACGAISMDLRENVWLDRNSRAGARANQMTAASGPPAARAGRYALRMRTSFGLLAFLQLGSLVAIVALMVLSDTWPPMMFWVVFIGLFVAVDAGLLMRHWADRRRARR